MGHGHGGITSLYQLLRDHAGAVEADLQRFYRVDLGDYWRRTDSGRRRLTLRRLCVLVVHLPLDSATAVALNRGKEPWRREHHQLDDLRLTVEALWTDAKKHKPRPHPERMVGQKARAERRDHSPTFQRKRAAALRRKRERERAIAAGEIT